MDKFVDEIVISVKGGAGGKGAVSFHREKYKPVGPPDGGDGGDGGSIILAVDPHLTTLNHLTKKNEYRAHRGQEGMKNRKHGADSPDIILKVPPGSMVYDNETGDLLCELYEPDAQHVIAAGGKGGKGNFHFKNSINRSTKKHGTGYPGEERVIRIELKLIADVGLVGLPNAGKSTLLAAMSAAKPKIAEYAFTTLKPNLGIIEWLQDTTPQRLLMADIPGLIEDAHKGAGLGISFLKHIERTNSIVYILDAAGGDCARQYELLQNELRSYDKKLLEKLSIIAVNKIDLLDDMAVIDELQHSIGKEVIPISAAQKRGLDTLKERLFTITEV